MKKMIPVLLILPVLLMLLTACGSALNYDSAAPMASSGNSGRGEAGDSYLNETTALGGSSGGRYTGSGVIPITAPVTDTGLAEKIIYTVDAHIETLRFDETIDMIYAMLVDYGAFIENSNISGVNMETARYGWSSYRYAYFSLRVPKDNLNSITANLGNLGNVVRQSSNAQNISSQFFDSQSRLTSLEIQEERLLDMLSKSDDITDLIALEERLGDIRYQIESLTTTLRNWQNQVDYSTLVLNINEVEIYTEPPQIHRTYWEQVGDGFISSLKGVGNFFMNLFKWFVTNLPVLVLLAGIGFLIFIIIKAGLRSSRKKKVLRQQNLNRQYMDQWNMNQPNTGQQQPPEQHQPPEQQNTDQ